MKIVAPLSHPDELEPLLKEKPDEIYFGVMDNSWLKDYSNIISTSRREFKSQNLQSKNVAKEIVKRCRQESVKTSLTVNSHFYDAKQSQLISKLIDTIRPDNIIVADLGLINYLREKSVNMHLSTGACALNSNAIEFFKKQGISRVILPRHILIDEVNKMQRKLSKVELEIFMLNQGCINLDGLCYYLHGLKDKNTSFTKKRIDSLKKKAYQYFPDMLKKRLRYLTEIDPGYACLQTYKITDKNGKKRITSFNPHTNGGTKCGVCALSCLENKDSIRLKIVGRENNLAKKIKDIRFLKEVFNNINLPKREFIVKCQEIHYKYYNEKCNDNKCYYQII